jgi:hypothetical protein
MKKYCIKFSSLGTASLNSSQYNGSLLVKWVANQTKSTQRKSIHE